MSMIEPREFLTRTFRAGVVAADPRRVTRQAADGLADLTPAVWVIAVGKGAHGMASGAVESLRERNVRVAGGLVVAHAPDENATHGLEPVQGDHPTPGTASFAAADRLSEVAARTTSDTDALVLVSGGATSLIASPVEGVSESGLKASFDALLASGADISLMNAIRKRLLRFGGGRLALAVQSRRVHCLIASDVIGNDPASIASGPCVADATSASDLRARAGGTWDALPSGVRQYLDAMAEGRVPDIARPDHPRFASTSVKVILDRTHAEHAAALCARSLGATVEIRPDPLSGEAATAGQRFAQQLIARERRLREAIVWSGETTVTLGTTPGRGGRCQEFALACALAFESAGDGPKGITVLAAGTDGRDGPTNAAGAIVDATTCAAIRSSGFDPALALQYHSSYDALESAGALLRTGPTGTNVNDLVITLRS